MSTKLLESWPETARDILLDAARVFYRQMNEPFAVYDVYMDEAIEWANEKMESRQDELYEEASDAWINKWERGKLDPEMKTAIEETYDRLRRAERGLRAHSTAKKRPRQLDAEIAQALSKHRR
jgi:hypothetical protein